MCYLFPALSPLQMRFLSYFVCLEIDIELQAVLHPGTVVRAVAVEALKYPAFPGTGC